MKEIITMPCTRGCVAPPVRTSCPIPLQYNQTYEYRTSATALPRVLCLGDSIGGPSCRAASEDPRVAGKLELHPILFGGGGNRTVLLNSFGSSNLLRCVSTWLQGTCRSTELRPPCPAPVLHWRSVILGAGAWDLQSRPCCEQTEAMMQRLVSTVRSVVETALRHADTVVWMTTTPAPEHAGCCHDPKLNYSGHEHLRGQVGTVGYCNHDASTQNRLVAAMVRATFSTQRVAIADTHSAVASRCGASYRHCAIQSQFASDGKLVMCNVHFTPSGYAEVHGPAVARALSSLVL